MDNNKKNSLRTHGSHKRHRDLVATTPEPPVKSSHDNESDNNNNNNNNKQSNQTDEKPMLTPHTLRLLKLIQEGTTEHAQIAAKHLTLLTAQSSPIILWDILGCLQSYLLSTDWRTRHNASLAMQGVAQHLPLCDQESFLQEIQQIEQEKQQQQENNIWLTLKDLESNGVLDTIGNKGRLLLASSESHYNEQEEDQLRQFDESSKDNDDFCKQRIYLQRQILAQRLGLLGVVNVVHEQSSTLSSTITQDDLLLPEAKRQKHSERIKKRENDTEESNSIRALLVMEMKRAGGSHAKSHKLPQSLLATELIYRMFDPSWTTRHGALLGIIALLRAWKTYQTNKLFGVWPHDILARCLCVLILDRFGDYSGASISDFAGGVVAPVREMSGQVFSILFLMAPESLQQKSLSLVHALVDSNEWEITFGALIALKYVTLVINNKENDDNIIIMVSDHKNQLGGRKYLVDIFDAALKNLNNSSDDVKGIAAQILLSLIGNSPTKAAAAAATTTTTTTTTTKTIKSSTSTSKSSLSSSSFFLDQSTCIHRASLPLWHALQSTRSVATCLVDLVKLFATMLLDNCEVVLSAIITDSKCQDYSNIEVLPQVLCLLKNLLDNEFMSVKISAIQAIGTIAQPVSLYLADETNNKHGASLLFNDAMINSFLDLFKKVYWSFFDSTFIQTDNHDGTYNNDNDDNNDKFVKLRRSSWSQLVNAIVKVLSHCHDSQWDLTSTLLIKYFSIKCTNTSSRNEPAMARHGSEFKLLLEQANALSEYLVNVCNINTTTTNLHIERIFQLIEFCICAFFEYPWMLQCEASCLLVQALSNRITVPAADTDNPLCQLLVHCHSKLNMILQTTPFCVKTETSNHHLSSTELINLCQHSFQCGMETIESGSSTSQQACQLVIDLWKQAFRSKEFDCDAYTPNMTPLLMRISSVIAGTIIAGGRGSLPQTLTPLVRALMTSIKNETYEARQHQTCIFLTNLITILGDDSITDERTEAFVRSRGKILNNLCQLIQKSKSLSTPAFVAASKVIRLLVGKIPTTETIEYVDPVWSRLEIVNSNDVNTTRDDELLLNGLKLLYVVCKGLQPGTKSLSHVISTFGTNLVCYCCDEKITLSDATRKYSLDSLQCLWLVDPKIVLEQTLPQIVPFLQDRNHDTSRLLSCKLLQLVVEDIGTEITPFVRLLLPLSMSLMTDSVEQCSKISTNIFASLVRIAPLVSQSTSSSSSSVTTIAIDNLLSGHADSVIDHLINGKPLPPCQLPELVTQELQASGVKLRHYQTEGISWLRYLQSVNLNGALCDSMGLGKTLQALVGVALAHCDSSINNNNDQVDDDGANNPMSLVVCPSTVVGHWIKEICRFFPNKKVLRASTWPDNNLGTDHSSLWKKLGDCNVLVISYITLRSMIDILASKVWCMCILDEGHLLKNPKTVTARAARRIRSCNKLILSGTPIQNEVSELWAAFDFLMPNFLGNSKFFHKQFANPITKGQKNNASAEEISQGMEKLKLLHQQVLPFILRREKEQVLKELPPKLITTIPCSMSTIQQRMYSEFCAGPEAKQSLQSLQQVLGHGGQQQQQQQQQQSLNTLDDLSLGSNTLKALLYLRLLCTHPSLVSTSKDNNDNNKDNDTSSCCGIESSGKLLALLGLFRDAGIHTNTIVGADKDTSLLYCESEYDENDDEVAELLTTENDAVDEIMIQNDKKLQSKSKCLVFAQFTHSLDVVEELLLKRYMPHVQYLRLDGRVHTSQRSDIVDKFNNDDEVRILLLTTRIGGLGLNLTGADIVIFLEHDWNPFADLQSMDRAHRIGQEKTVHVYKLVTTDSIEERMMELQEKKIAVSKAIINTDNSTMFSMGTDRLLDIFTFRSEVSSESLTSEKTKTTTTMQQQGQYHNLDALVDLYKEDYATLSVEEFVKAFSV